MNGSSFVFKPFSDSSGSAVEFSRFNGDGTQLWKKLFPLPEHEGGILSRERSGLYTLITETLAGFDADREKRFLLVHPVNPALPEDILREENYRQFSKLKRRIHEQVGADLLLYQRRGIHEVDSLVL